MKELFKRVTQWLAACGSPCFDFVAYELTVEGESKALAVQYSQTVEGRTETSLYVVAPLPRKYRPGTMRKNGSEFFGAGKNFYLACYYPPKGAAYAPESTHPNFHPFGANYILREITDLAAHRIAGELPHRLPIELLPLTEGE